MGKWRATRVAGNSVDVGLFVQRAHLKDGIYIRENEDVLSGVYR